MEKPTIKRVRICVGHGMKTTPMEFYHPAQVDAYVLLLEQRAEAAEAQLAELAKQEPAAFTSDYYWSELNRAGRVNCWLRNDRRDPGFQVELFTRPAPAVNLADLVPDEMTPKEASRAYGGEVIGYRDGFNACVAKILRNIEEAKK